MKRIILLVLASLILHGCSTNTQQPQSQDKQQTENTTEILKPVLIGQLSGKDPSSLTPEKVLVKNINVWQKPEVGGRNNVSVGRVPHGTDVSIVERKAGWYHIQTQFGEISNLATNWDIRGEQMDTLEEYEWYRQASEHDMVDGWVAESFLINVTDIK